MSDNINLFISNGTCYYGIKREADETMLPCGNDANDHVACCQAGDNCLDSSVCFNSQFGVTYLAGCSDPDYEHPRCPNKFEYIETPWVGLSYCNGTSNEWAICDQKKKPATLTKPDPCYCAKDVHDRNGQLHQSSIIEGTASLPVSRFDSIQFSVGHYPTKHTVLSTTTVSSTTAVEPPSSPTPSSRAPIAAATTAADAIAPSSSNDAGLSPSAQTGAIAGGVAGALVIALLLAGCLYFRRRQKKQQLQREEEERAVDNFMHGDTKSGAASEPDPLNLGIAPGGMPPPSTASSPDTCALSELDSKAARPWSLRSELDNNPSARGSYNPAAGGHNGIGLARTTPSELAAHSIAELPG